MSKTLFDKVWDSHVVRSIQDGPDVFFIDRHFIHEVTSPVAFLGLKQRGISVLYPNRTFATADHNTPTINQHLPVEDVDTHRCQIAFRLFWLLIEFDDAVRLIRIHDPEAGCFFHRNRDDADSQAGMVRFMEIQHM